MSGAVEETHSRTSIGPVTTPRTTPVSTIPVVLSDAIDPTTFTSDDLSLTRNGKAVRFLKTGRYTFSVDDESPANGFSVQVLKGKVRTVTTKAYVGNHDVTLALKPRAEPLK